MPTSVLVLEDDLNMQEMLVEYLEDAGYAAQGAGSADAALELSKAFKFDLIVSDVRMAGGTDGLGALAALKQRVPELRCIVITGFASEDAPRRAMQIQVDDYVYKPFTPQELLGTVKRVLASGQERTGYRALLAGMLSGPRKLLEKAEAALRESAVKTLEHHRDRVFQGFFVALRSKLLTTGAALDVWDQLERLEAGYVDKVVREQGTAAEVKAGAERYQQLFELMSAMARSESIGTLANRQPWQVDRATFGHFYSRVQGGQITPEQLRVAVSVWRSTPEDRKHHPELLRLHQLMWAA